ncbi:hypothetical protein CDAR_12411 [Caerostris darwini]|uniref:Uncharacterized protein n=1 Tax=Caerostris darwini TaxID=1538125 RepID=A0AAV4V247_9ARAC|nr:hypothetical protein CDAR_12411 [Caerostris darwini]
MITPNMKDNSKCLVFENLGSAHLQIVGEFAFYPSRYRGSVPRTSWNLESRLNCSLDNGGIIEEEQAGLRRFKSTNHPVALLSQSVKDNRRNLFAVFVDFKCLQSRMDKRFPFEALWYSVDKVELVPWFS